MKRPTANHYGGRSQMLVDGRQRPLDDTWCFFLPCRGIFVTSWWVFAVTWKRGKNSAHENAYIETLLGARMVRATPSMSLISRAVLRCPKGVRNNRSASYEYRVSLGG